MAGTALSDTAWTEVTAATAMTDGATYAFQIHAPSDRKVYAVDVNGSSEPSSTEDAQVLFPQSERPLEQLEFTKRAGRTWWMRTDHGPARFVAWEV